MKIRLAARNDWAAIAEIYNHAVAEGLKTADTEPISVDTRHEWFVQHEGGRYPFFVAEADSIVVGFCSLSAHRPGRKALSRVAEVSYYVHRNHRRRGIGPALLRHVIHHAPELGFRHLFALLLDVNRTSIRMLERAGFTRWGHLPNVADLGGVICGQVIYGRSVESG
jgi:phosphinothricin acetyltransferase